MKIIVVFYSCKNACVLQSLIFLSHTKIKGLLLAKGVFN